MKEKNIGFFPYVDVKNKNQKNANIYGYNMQKNLAKYGNIVPYYHIKEHRNNIWKMDYIFLNWYEMNLTFADKCWLLMAKLCKKKIVWTFHNRIRHDSIDVNEDKASIRFMIKIADYILVLSKSSIPYIDEAVGKKRSIRRKIVYVPHVNYCENYLPKKGTEDRISNLNEFIFLYFGQIRPYKNLEVLIEAYKQATAEKSKLVIAGKPYDAAYAKKIKKLCGDNKKIELDFRFIDDEEVYDYMSRADVVVLPYDKASSMNSGAMIAAFTCKKPVIVPDIAMARDYRNSKYVYMYRYQDEVQHLEKLAEMMKRAYINGKEQNQMLGEQAYEEVRKNNSAEEVRRCMEKIW